MGRVSQGNGRAKVRRALNPLYLKDWGFIHGASFKYDSTLSRA